MTEIPQIITGLQKSLSSHEFILTGGTALSFQIKHRISKNIELFTNKTFFNTNILLKKIAQQGLSFTIQQEDEYSITLFIQNIKTTFTYYPYPLIEKPVIKDEILMSDLLDIASNIIIEICNKGQKKDFVDLFFILKQIPFEHIAQNAIKKYGKERINPLTIGKSLIYFADADLDPEVMYYEEPYPLWEDIKKFFIKNSKTMVYGLQGGITPI